MDTLRFENKKPLINQNKNKWFKIKKYKNWDNCVEVEYDFTEDINLFNLFLIVKSFILSSTLICHYIAINYIDLDSKILVSEKIPTFKFKKMNYYEFGNWFEWKNENNKKYVLRENYCSFVFMFEKQIIEKKNIDLDNISPTYPWNNEFIIKFKKDMDEIDFLKKENEILKKKINELNKIK